MDLFYTPSSRIDLGNGTAILKDEEFFHSARVMRRKPGDLIGLTDGCGLCATAVIRDIGKDMLVVDILHARHQPPPETRLTVAISLLKSADRFDFFLEKSAELGVSSVVPMVSSRTVSRPQGTKGQRKVERWRQVMLAALRQSKRCWLPQISEPRPFSDILGLPDFDERFIAYECADGTGGIPAFQGQKILIAVGGEGGFSRDEFDKARHAGFQSLSFGSSILRAETAGMFAVALVRAQLLERGGEASMNRTCNRGDEA